jgi:hypothetical protein
VSATHPVVVNAPPNAGGWYTSDVSFAWRWTDAAPGSGLDPTACPAATTSSGEGVQTLSGACADLAGNVASAALTVRVDKSAPASTLSLAGGVAGMGKILDATGAIVATVGVTCSPNASLGLQATDAGSGVASLNYSLGGVQTSVQGASAQVSLAGISGRATLTYAAVDFADWSEAPHSETLVAGKGLLCAFVTPPVTLPESGTLSAANTTLKF